MKPLFNTARLLIVSLGIVISVGLSSCIKDHIDMDKLSYTVDWPVKYGMPVAYGSLSLGDIVSIVDKNGYVKEDNTGLLYLLYRDNVFSQTAKNLLTIPDQSYPQSFSIIDKGFPVGTGLDSVKFSRDTTFSFGFNKSDVEIDSIIFKGGLLSVSSNITFPFIIRVDITFPTFKKNGTALKIPIRKTTNAPSYVNTTTPVSLDGYNLQFNKQGATSNLIPVHYDIAIINNKSIIAGGQSISSTINLTSAGFSSIFGYLGQIPDLLNKVNQTMTIDFFENPNNSSIKFNNPAITVYIRNSFGVPIQIQLSNAKTHSDITNTDFPFTITPPTKDVNYPTINQVGKIAYDTLKVDNTVHPNIFDAIQTSPHYLYYTENAIANRLGKTGISNFFTDSSKVDVDVELKLPFEMQAGNIEATDTIKDLNLNDIIKDTTMVKKVAIYNTFKNSIPFDLKLQIYLTDDTYHYIDSLYNKTIDNKNIAQPIIKSGKPDPGNPGRYIFSDANTFGVVFDGNRAKLLKNVKHAIMRVSMATAGGGTTYVKFFSNYRLNVAFQVQTELEVTSLNQF